MLPKEAQEIVLYQLLTFCDQLLLAEKVTGGCTLVINLSLLNTFVAQMKFRMEMVLSVLATDRKGNVMFSVELKDSHFQIQSI